MFYAQLNDQNVCVGLSNLSGVVDAANVVLIDENDEDKLWRKYENGVWSTDKFPPAVIPPPTVSLEDRVKATEDAIIALMGL